MISTIEIDTLKENIYEKIADIKDEKVLLATKPANSFMTASRFASATPMNYFRWRLIRTRLIISHKCPRMYEYVRKMNEFPNNMVLVFAHPDDEVLWASSMLMKADKVITCFSDSFDDIELSNVCVYV